MKKYLRKVKFKIELLLVQNVYFDEDGEIIMNISRAHVNKGFTFSVKYKW